MEYKSVRLVDDSSNDVDNIREVVTFCHLFVRWFSWEHFFQRFFLKIKTKNKINFR